MKKTIIITITVLVLVAVVFTGLIFDWGRGGNTTATSTATSTLDLPIVVFSPTENQTVTSPIRINGKARGGWFFEAVFPVSLVDSSGKEIARVQAHAQTDWMTNDFVDFSAEITYSNATNTGRALLILSNDNPSGNPETEQSIFVPVILK